MANTTHLSHILRIYGWIFCLLSLYGCLLSPKSRGNPNDPAGDRFAIQTLPEIEAEPPGGTYVRPISVTLYNPEPETEIRYTLDGGMPDENSAVAEGPIPIGQTTTLRAIAYKPDYMPSSVFEAFYEITGTIAKPVLKPRPGYVAGDETLEITTTTDGAIIRYSLDDSPLDREQGLLYDGPFMLKAGKTYIVRFYIYVPYWPVESDLVYQETYEVGKKAHDPIMEPDSGAYPAPLTISVSMDTVNAVVYLTRDGSDPISGNAIRITESTEWVIQKSETWKAFAMVPGKDATASAVVTRVYEITP